MSPLLRDRIQVFFAPDRIDLVRSFRGIKPKEDLRLVAPCEREPSLPAWEPPLGQLEQMIEDAAGVDMSITISNDLVRYAVVSAQTQIASPSELYAYAAFHMREVYGERAGTWALSISAWDPCGGAVCAAIERNLLERLGDIAIRRKVRLKSIKPYLTSAFDQWRKRFDGSQVWFALIETGRLCVVLLSNGAWHRISNRRMLHRPEDELLAALDQEALLFSRQKEEVQSVYLFAPEHPEMRLPSDCGWQVVPLLTEGKPAPPDYPSALIFGRGN
ncbi:hypothetical protein [Nitrosospira sp. Nsp1]|uniref:hypothetical protein n=1 Tax=Nitrosospira sp. Nsp1 TaxID=136547 RepID=UPI0008924474|nr:hypothetical protein [Nitrosospira sp. Nsp1]SCX38640.1 hypothetical protein SAMN05720354_10253 [Nitrosospira sp. Nsp1]